MRQVSSPLLFIACFLTWTGLSGAQDDARAIVVKAVQAHGGEEKLAKVRADRAQIKGMLYISEPPIAFTGETLVQQPGQFKNTMSFKQGGTAHTIIQALDGDKAWISVDGKISEPEAAVLRAMTEQLHVDRLLRLTALLKDKDLTLTPLEETKVNDQPAVGLKVAARGHNDVSLYFDKEKRLLLKAEYKTTNNQKREVLQEDYFSNFREVGGITRPMKAVAFQDGRKLMEAEITDLKYPEKVPDAEFRKP